MHDNIILLREESSFSDAVIDPTRIIQDIFGIGRRIYLVLLDLDLKSLTEAGLSW